MANEIKNYLAATTPGAGPDRRVLAALFDALINAQHDYIVHVRRCTGESAACHEVTANYYGARDRYFKGVWSVLG